MASRGAKTIPTELPLARTDCMRNHPCVGAIGNWHTYMCAGLSLCVVRRRVMRNAPLDTLNPELD